jgi:hypothetical protein
VFFYVDESGNSGNNLFDPNQPILSYGVLSSETNIDERAAEQFAGILEKVSRPTLHASKLKFDGLRPIANDLLALHRGFRLGFDVYFIEKRAYALVAFFNAVFDPEVNEAIPGLCYWTPVRFTLIALLHNLLDNSILREAWELCLVPRSSRAKQESRIVELLRRCLALLEASEMQAEPREVIRNALLFGIHHPLALDFGAYSQKAFSPNAIGFQFVLLGIARRLQLSGRSASKIVVDRQSQFNASQREAFSLQSKKAEWFRNNPEDRKQHSQHPFFVGVQDDVDTLISHFPEQETIVCDSKDSVGLQITDTFLWLVNRAIREDANVPPELRPLTLVLLTTGLKNGISLPLMMNRWREFERNLPAFSSLTAEQKALGDALKEEHMRKVRDMKLQS